MKPPPNSEFERDRKYTEEWLEQGQVERVIAHCREVLEVNPDCDRAYKILGNICAAKGEFDRAIEYYEAALHRQPDRGEIYADLGSAYARKQQFKLAGAYYQKAITLDPHLYVAYLNLAKLLQRLGKDREATDYLYRASKLQPERLEAEQHLNLGNQLLAQQQLTQAIVCYKQALKIDPNLFAAYQKLAEVSIRQGNIDEANRYDRRAKQLELTQAPGQTASNSDKEPDKKPEKESDKKSVDRAVQREISSGRSPQNSQKDSTAGAREKTGDAWVARGELDEAVIAYRQALELAPRSWQLYHKLGDVLQARGKLYEALEAYDRATALVTENAPEELPDKPPSA